MFQSLTNPKFGKLGMRFVAFVLDFFLVSIIYGLVTGVISGDISSVFSRFGGSTGNEKLDILIGCVIFLLYVTLLQAYWNGQTLGMKVSGIKTVNAKGESVTMLQAFLRNVVFLATTILTLGITVAINYVLLVFTVKQNTIHDMLSKTYIVPVKK